jgi:hypothetical protein
MTGEGESKRRKEQEAAKARHTGANRRRDARQSEFEREVQAAADKAFEAGQRLSSDGSANTDNALQISNLRYVLLALGQALQKWKGASGYVGDRWNRRFVKGEEEVKAWANGQELNGKKLEPGEWKLLFNAQNLLSVGALGNISVFRGKDVQAQLAIAQRLFDSIPSNYKPNGQIVKTKPTRAQIDEAIKLAKQIIEDLNELGKLGRTSSVVMFAAVDQAVNFGINEEMYVKLDSIARNSWRIEHARVSFEELSLPVRGNAKKLKWLSDTAQEISTALHLQGLDQAQKQARNTQGISSRIEPIGVKVSVTSQTAPPTDEFEAISLFEGDMRLMVRRALQLYEFCEGISYSDRNEFAADVHVKHQMLSAVARVVWDIGQVNDKLEFDGIKSQDAIELITASINSLDMHDRAMLVPKNSIVVLSTGGQDSYHAADVTPNGNAALHELGLNLVNDLIMCAQHDFGSREHVRIGQNIEPLVLEFANMSGIPVLAAKNLYHFWQDAQSRTNLPAAELESMFGLLWLPGNSEAENREWLLNKGMQIAQMKKELESAAMP